MFADDDEDDWEGEDGGGSFRITINDDQDDDLAHRDGLPDGARLSVRVREDFVLVDEEAFRASAMRIFEQQGPWPPQVGPDDPATIYLSALVEEIGLHEISFGTTIAGLENAGGQTEVLAVDAALQDDEDW